MKVFVLSLLLDDRDDNEYEVPLGVFSSDALAQAAREAHWDARLTPHSALPWNLSQESYFVCETELDKLIPPRATPDQEDQS